MPSAWDKDELKADLEHMRAEGTLDARGRQIDSYTLGQILDAARPSPGQHPVFLSNIDFSGATFKERASFRDTMFQGVADFGDATFEGDADFKRALFAREAKFRKTTFKGNADFLKAIFASAADFEKARFEANADFGEVTDMVTQTHKLGATFKGHAGFDGAIFNGHAMFLYAIFADAADFGNVTFADAVFSQAIFMGSAGFKGATFKGHAMFDSATFARDSYASVVSPDAGEAGSLADADFGKAKFEGDAEFTAATFKGDAGFGGATFSGEARFGGATFVSRAWFAKDDAGTSTTFECDAWFGGATFKGRATFAWATFNGHAGFDGATFLADAGFGGVNFKRDACLENATFVGHAYFLAATFDVRQQLGPVLVCQRLMFDDSRFAGRVSIEFSARNASFRRTAFRGGADVLADWGDVALDETEFGGASLVAPPRRMSDLPPPRSSFRPRVVSLRHARVANLVLADVDLRACQFAGAHRLEGLRFEGDSRFAPAPTSWRWAARRTLAEEHRWRFASASKEIQASGIAQKTRRGPRRWLAARRRNALERKQEGWYPNECEAPDWSEDRGEIDPSRIAGIYRALRKGLEDSKNEPGAADFYYGEMEMRRHSAPIAERSILWLYWMVSGYGLRASRALLAWLPRSRSARFFCSSLASTLASIPMMGRSYSRWKAASACCAHPGED